MPSSPSWINLMECWFSILSARQLKRGRFRSTRAMENAIRHYVAVNNDHPKPFVWTKTTDKILQSVAEFCVRTSDSYY